MSLVNCPDCGKAVSNSAVACPNCGYPLTPASVQTETIVQEVPPVIEKESFPKWVFIPLAIIGGLLIFMLIVLFRQGEDDQRNINIDVSARRSTNSTNDRTTSARTDNEPNQITVPPTSETNVSTVPQTVPPTTQSTVTNVPAETTQADRGSLSIDAKVLDRTGDTRAVTDEKFYLLDKDLENILRDADIEAEAGQTLTNTFGLSVLYPDRYSEINRKALAEINKHVVYDTLTDNSGKAKLDNIKPDSYYLFGITKTRNGFAIWSSPVTIVAGQNQLNLSPQRVTEMSR